VLEKPAINGTLATDVQAYLHETLDADAHIRQWDGARNLPYYLQDAFDLYEFQLRDREILLASGRKGQTPKLRTLRTQLDKLVHLADRPVVFATSTLASYERRRLVEQKVPFVVPGNQLYLPDLGIDFREYFRQPHSAVTAFTPATQAMFIAALLRREWRDGWQPAELLEELGYTTMTMTRAVRELAAAGLMTAHQEGRTRQLHLRYPQDQVWDQAAPFLRTPVKRTVWVDDQRSAKRPRVPLASLSALAFYSMLAEPEHPTYAVSAAHWKAAQEAGIHILQEPQPGACQWEVWSYTPSLGQDSQVVDPLSLTLSLKDESDDRVRQALEALRGQFPW
jgi:hypothetical protein